MMVFFSTAVASQAQGITITFPQYGASNIAIDAKITMQVNEPMYRTNFYKQKSNSIDVYYNTILY